MSKLNELLSKIITKVNASVKTEAQSLSDAEKAQARENIGAVPIPEKAKPGQTVVVKAVDESNAPTEWGTADLCAGEIVIGTVITSDGVTLTTEESANILAAIDSESYVTCSCTLDYDNTQLVCYMNVVSNTTGDFITLISEVDGLRILMSVMEDGSVVAMYEPPENKLPEVTLVNTVTSTETDLDESEWDFFDEAATAETPVVCKFNADIDQACEFTLLMSYVVDSTGMIGFMAHVGPYTFSIHKRAEENWKCAGFIQEEFSKSEVVDEAVSAAMEALPVTIPNIQSAKAEQAVVVKAVDSDGKPTEWEVVDPLAIDSSMTVEGAAADAKAVGDKLEDYATREDVINGNCIIFEASSTDGKSYTGTIEDLSEIKMGQVFIMIPNKASTSKNSISLNINGLGGSIYKFSSGTALSGLI